MNVVEKDEIIIISSYPIKLACLCLIIVFTNLTINLTVTLAQPVSMLLLWLGMIFPTLCLYFLSYRLTIVDAKRKVILTTQVSIRGKQKKLIEFSQIKAITREYLLGIAEQHTVCIETTGHQAIAITTLADASTRQQHKLIKKLSKLIQPESFKA